MADNNQEQQEQPKYLTHEDLNGALASQKKDMQKLITQQSQQFQQLLESFNKNFGPPPEKQEVPSKAVIAEDTVALKQQVKLLLEEREKNQADSKRDRLEKNLRDNLVKHGINSRSDLAIKYLQDQVSYDEDGQLVMKTEITPGVVTPLPLHEAIAKFAQTDQGKFLADPKDLRGSGSRSISAPGSQAHATITSQITGNSATPMFKDAKSLKAYVASELGKEQLKY
jgi:hypothetical protein